MKKKTMPALDGASEAGALTTVEDAPYRVSVSVRGVCRLLFHRWNCDAVEAKSKAAKGSRAKKSDDVESYVWRDEEESICIPGAYFCSALSDAGRYLQDPRSPRKSARDLLRASVTPVTELASLGVSEWDFIDRRRVVVQRNAITRERPAMHEGWEVTFILLVTQPKYVSPSMLHQTISMAGRVVGVGDYRPNYGRFEVSHFEVIT